jgi:hypothetical protein
MSTISLEGSSHPIDYKSYLQEEKKKILIQTIKLVALEILIFLGSTLFLCHFAGISFTAALLTFNFKPFLTTNFLRLGFGIESFLQTFTCIQIFFKVFDMIPIFKILSKLQPRKENAVIIQSPALPLSFVNLIKLAEKYNLKIFTTTSYYEAKSILSSFPKNSVKMVVLSGHGNSESIHLCKDCYASCEKTSIIDRDPLYFEKKIVVRLIVGFMRVNLLRKVVNIVFRKNFRPPQTMSYALKAISKDGIIILDSCFTGEGENNIARALSSLANRTVVASSKDSGDSEVESSLTFNDFTISKIKFLTPKIKILLFKNYCVAIPFFFKEDTTVIYKDGQRVL